VCIVKSKQAICWLVCFGHELVAVRRSSLTSSSSIMSAPAPKRPSGAAPAAVRTEVKLEQEALAALEAQLSLETRFEKPSDTVKLLYNIALATQEGALSGDKLLRNYFLERVTDAAVEAATANPPFSRAYHLARHERAKEDLGEDRLATALELVNHFNGLTAALQAKYRPLEQSWAERLENMIVERGTDALKKTGQCPSLMQLCTLKDIEETGQCALPAGSEPWYFPVPGGICATAQNRIRSMQGLAQKLDEQMMLATKFLVEHPGLKKLFTDTLNAGQVDAIKRIALFEFDEADIAASSKTINFLYEGAPSVVDDARSALMETVRNVLGGSDSNRIANIQKFEKTVPAGLLVRIREHVIKDVFGGTDSVSAPAPEDLKQTDNLESLSGPAVAVASEPAFAGGFTTLPWLQHGTESSFKMWGPTRRQIDNSQQIFTDYEGAVTETTIRGLTDREKFETIAFVAAANAVLGQKYITTSASGIGYLLSGLLYLKKTSEFSKTSKQLSDVSKEERKLPVQSERSVFKQLVDSGVMEKRGDPSREADAAKRMREDNKDALLQAVYVLYPQQGDVLLMLLEMSRATLFSFALIWKVYMSLETTDLFNRDTLEAFWNKVFREHEKSKVAGAVEADRELARSSMKLLSQKSSIKHSIEPGRPTFTASAPAKSTDWLRDVSKYGEGGGKTIYDLSRELPTGKATGKKREESEEGGTEAEA
jgi:hypothetical protein